MQRLSRRITIDTNVSSRSDKNVEDSLFHENTNDGSGMKKYHRRYSCYVWNDRRKRFQILLLAAVNVFIFFHYHRLMETRRILLLTDSNSKQQEWARHYEEPRVLFSTRYPNNNGIMDLAPLLLFRKGFQKALLTLATNSDNKNADPLQRPRILRYYELCNSNNKQDKDDNNHDHNSIPCTVNSGGWLRQIDDRPTNNNIGTSNVVDDDNYKNLWIATTKTIYMSHREERHYAHWQRKIKDSSRYELPKPKFYSECKSQHEWQDRSYPTCNTLHEYGVSSRMFSNNDNVDEYSNQKTSHSYTTTEQIKYLASGGYRDVWQMDHTYYVYNTNTTSSMTKKETVVVKTLGVDEDYDLDNYLSHIGIDAVANDRLSFSPYVSPIFAACGYSGVFEYGSAGSLEHILFEEEKEIVTIEEKEAKTIEEEKDNNNSTLTNSKRNDTNKEEDEENTLIIPSTTFLRWSSIDKLKLSYHVAASISDVHNTDIEGRAAISHTDIKSKQFIYMPDEGLLKLTDFNRARFLAWNVTNNNSTCTFKFDHNGGKYRSPEEYKYEPETEKIDVFMMGNVLYSILTGLKPFDDRNTRTANKLVIKGKRPYIDEKKYLNNNTDPFIQSILKAIGMCFVYDANERPTARDVERYIDSELNKHGYKTFNQRKVFF